MVMFKGGIRRKRFLGNCIRKLLLWQDLLGCRELEQAALSWVSKELDQTALSLGLGIVAQVAFFGRMMLSERCGRYSVW